MGLGSRSEADDNKLEALGQPFNKCGARSGGDAMGVIWIGKNEAPNVVEESLMMP